MVYRSTSSGAVDNYVLASDFATLQRQIDSSTSSLERKGDTINSGLCDGFYAQNTTMLNGFSQAELSRANGQTALMQQMNANNITAMQNTNALKDGAKMVYRSTRITYEEAKEIIVKSWNCTYTYAANALDELNYFDCGSCQIYKDSFNCRNW